MSLKVRGFLVFVLACGLFSSLQAHAYTHGAFLLGGRAIVTIENLPMGPVDNDARALYEAMNMVPKQTMIGPEKGIVTASRDFSLICGIRTGGTYTCSVFLQQSDRVTLDPAEQKAEFTLNGARAKAMTDIFVKGADGRFSYSTSDGEFILSGSDDEFHFTFKSSTGE